MRQRDLFIKESRLFEALYTTERLEAGFRRVKKNQGSPGVDGVTITEFESRLREELSQLKAELESWTYQPSPVRRVEMPKPGGKGTRLLGVPTVRDRVVQATLKELLEPIFEPLFSDHSYGFRPERNQGQAVEAARRIVAGGKPYVVELDLSKFFGSLDHGWLLRFVEHRVGDPRLISLLRRWLKAGILEDGEIHPNEEGTPQGGSISVLLSNVYLHYVLDLWFEQVVKSRLRGEAYLVRYIDDFVVCFQYREDALRVQEALRKRLGKFGLTLEPSKTKLVEFGRFAQRHAPKQGRKRPETIYFLGFTLYCTRNRKGNFKVGLRTEKSRLQRSLSELRDLMRRMRHLPVREQVINLNRVLRGHYAYYGIAGNLRALQKVHRFVERCWHKMLCSRSRKGYITWEVFLRIKARFPLQRPKLFLLYRELQAIAVL